MKMQSVVEGQYQINQLLKEGWKLEQLMTHSQRRERWSMGQRMDDGTDFWVVGVLSKEELTLELSDVPPGDGSIGRQFDLAR